VVEYLMCEALGLIPSTELNFKKTFLTQNTEFPLSIFLDQQIAMLRVIYFSQYLLAAGWFLFRGLEWVCRLPGWY
jgi:hypothetical protein